MFFMQGSPQDWPRAVQMLPDGALVKAIDRGDILRDVKAINPNIYTMLRHYGGPQTIFDDRGFEAYKDLAREFFLTFIDGTFREQYAQHTDFIQEWNEYIASTDGPNATRQRLDWVEAAAWVWKNEFRTQQDYEHIRLVICNTAVGNNIDRRFAEIADHYDCVVSYHAYDKYLSLNQRDPGSWAYHCGRWNTMDQAWGDLKVDWLFGEAGPYEGVLDGWRSSKVLGGDRDAYVAAMRRWIREIKTTLAYQEQRIKGFSLFVSGGTSQWSLYETAQPEMDMLAQMIREEWTPVAPPPPPPPPPPPIEVRRYRKTGHLVKQSVPRRRFDAVLDLAWENKESVFFSADDWAQPSENTELVIVTQKKLIAWDIDEILNKPLTQAKADIEAWADLYFAEPEPEFEYRSIDELFVAATWGSPVGTKAERTTGNIWPGNWVDATPYLTRYRLGSGWAVHTGADLNLNFPVFDMDRNKPIYSVASGKVIYAGVPASPFEGWQGLIVIEHEMPDGSFVYSRYGHVQAEELFISAGDWVKKHDMIGLTGRNMSGSEPGPYHLHFDISHTDILKTEPWHWPGDNRDLVIRHYSDPLQWIRNHRT